MQLAPGLAYKAISYKSLESILKSGLDQVDVEEPVNQKRSRLMRTSVDRLLYFRGSSC